MRFSGHESFAYRYTWLPKGYRAVVNDPATFGNVEQAIVSLGVGKNMVRSIRFWVEVMGVVIPRKAKTLEPTYFGEAVFRDGGFDPFLEDIQTLWLLHWNMASRTEDPLFAWEFLLHQWPYVELTRSEALAAFARELQRRNMHHSDVTLGQHLDAFLHTYVSTHGSSGPREESLDCPLAELELLQNVGERRVDSSGKRQPVYVFRRESKPEITAPLFEYCLDDYWHRRHASEATLTYRDVAIATGSIGQVFNLPEDEIQARLDVYVSPEALRPFNYQPSTVRGLLSRRELGTWDFLAAVYSVEDISG